MAKKLLGPAPSGADDAVDKAYVDGALTPGYGYAPIASGDMLHTPFSGNVAGSDAMATGVWGGSPIYVVNPFTIDALGVRVSTGQAINAKLLLYNSDAGGNPSTLVATATISCATVGYTIGTLGSNVDLSRGMYWGFIRTDSGTTVRFLRVQNQNTMSGYTGVWTGTTVNYQMPGADVGTYASPSTTLTPVATNNAYNLFLVRRA